MGIARSITLFWENKKRRIVEDRKNEEIENHLRKWEREENKNTKILLLGNEGSGKNTLMKQLKILYGNGWSDEERATMRIVICRYIVKSMKCMIHYVTEAGMEIECEKAINVINECDKNILTIDSAVVAAIKQVWNDPSTQLVWNNRSRYNNVDQSIKYFCEEIERIGNGNEYIPNNMDILQVREEADKVKEEIITINERKATILDFGPIERQRKNHMQLIKHIENVIFVIGLDEYDHYSSENQSITKLEESLSFFEEKLNSKEFNYKAIVLYLNKTDLFEDKILKVPIRAAGVRNERSKEQRIYNPKYDNREEYIQYMYDYILDMFYQRIEASGHRVNRYRICAIDNMNVHYVFTSTFQYFLLYYLESYLG